MAENQITNTNNTAGDKTTSPATDPVANHSKVLEFSCAGIFIILLMYSLYFASGFFIPVLIATVLNLLLSPVARVLSRFYIPPPIGAAFIVIFVLVTVVLGFAQLSGPASEWIEEAPGILRKAESKLLFLKEPVEEVKAATEKVEKAVDIGSEGPSLEEPVEVVVKEPGLLQAMIGTFQTATVHLVFASVLLYFFLAAGDFFRETLVESMPKVKDRKRFAELAWQLERDVSNYLFTITLINLGLGIVVGATLYLVGLPNAYLWGALAAGLNFIPYVGAIIGVVIVALVSLMTFDSLGAAIIGPLAYATINAMEGYLLTPAVLGKRLSLSPVVVFLWVGFWAWFWGIAGALLAVPLLIILKVASDRVDGLETLSMLLSGQRKVAGKLPELPSPASET